MAKRWMSIAMLITLLTVAALAGVAQAQAPGVTDKEILLCS